MRYILFFLRQSAYMPTQGLNPWDCKAEGVGAQYSKTPTLCPKPKIEKENRIKEQNRWR